MKKKNEGEEDIDDEEEDEDEEDSEDTDEEDDEDDDSDSDEDDDEDSDDDDSDDEDDDSDDDDSVDSDDDSDDKAKGSKKDWVKDEKGIPRSAKWWADRTKKAEKTIQDNKKDGKKTKKPEGQKNSDEVSIARLEARGILDEDAQAEVLEYARNKNISVVEALSDKYVVGRLAFLKAEKKEKKAAMRPSTRTGGVKTSKIDRLVAKYQKDGSLPSNKRLQSKILDRLAAKGS